MLKAVAQNITQVANTAATTVGKAPAAAGKSFDVIRREAPVPAQPPTSSGPLGAQGANPVAAPETGLAARSVQRIVQRDRRIQHAMSRALRGADMSPQELLALQLQVHKYSMEVETVSRVVDRVTGAVKQTMNTQI